MTFYQNFGDLDTVQRGTFTNVVGHDPEANSAGMGDILTNSANIDRIGARPFADCRRITAIGPLVEQTHSGCF